MRTRATMTISLPRQMIQEVARVRKSEHRTRSDLIRETLRAYFNARRSFPDSTPAAAEPISSFSPWGCVVLARTHLTLARGKVGPG